MGLAVTMDDEAADHREPTTSDCNPQWVVLVFKEEDLLGRITGIPQSHYFRDLVHQVSLRVSVNRLGRICG